MSSNDTSRDNVKHSDPITINTSARRHRSVSVSSGSSSSGSSASEVQTPASTPANSNRTSLPSPGSSPILSYFLGQSPVKTPGTATFPFSRKFGPPPVFEDEEEVPATAHARRASTTVAGRFAQPQATPLPDPQLERGSGLLRRLSLSSGAFAKPKMEGLNNGVYRPPSPPPNTAVSPTARNMPFSRETKPRRSATINEGSRPRRAPSPMGERILKGHFDGFN